jgi:hypothetical protein
MVPTVNNGIIVLSLMLIEDGDVVLPLLGARGASVTVITVPAFAALAD